MLIGVMAQVENRSPNRIALTQIFQVRLPIRYSSASLPIKLGHFADTVCDLIDILIAIVLTHI